MGTKLPTPNYPKQPLSAAQVRASLAARQAERKQQRAKIKRYEAAMKKQRRGR